VPGVERTNILKAIFRKGWPVGVIGALWWSVGVNAQEVSLEEKIQGQTQIIVKGDPTEPSTELETLKQFGYDIFNALPAEVDTVIGAVDPEYPVGPGDEVVITVWGQVELFYELTVDREGGVNIPKVGRLQVSGVPIGELEGKIRRLLSRAYSTINEDPTKAVSFVDVTLGKLRTIQVFVVGEVSRPGAYMVSATSTVVKALYQAGGATTRGSLRDIQQVRHDEVVHTLDFYRFMQEGLSGEKMRLQNGDVVVVPPSGKEVILQGQVHRPAMYELRREEGLRRLIEIAGGLEPEAYTERVQIERIEEHRERTVVDVNWAGLVQSGEDFLLVDGDRVTFFPIPDRYENAVAIEGYVEHPGIYQLRPGMTVKGLVRQAKGVQEEAYIGRGHLVRTYPDLTQEIIPFHVGKALQGNPEHNWVLEPMDKVILFSIHTFGDEESVTINGLVRKPGPYPLLQKMTLQDLIVAASGLTDFAYKLEAEIARFDPEAVIVEESVKMFRVAVSNEYEVGEGGEEGFVLQDRDEVFIRRNPDLEPKQFVSVEGLVQFPGKYALMSRGERLSDLIRRAGGLVEEAYPEGIQILRGELGVIGADVRTALKNPGGLDDVVLKEEAYPEGIQILRGELGVIGADVRTALKNPGGLDDVVLKDGDIMTIPQRPSTVEVVGEVFRSRGVLFQPGKGADFYWDRAGGLKDSADQGRIYIELPNGETIKPKRFLFFWRRWPKILPGSRVIVPAQMVRVQPEGNE
jgi:protein involved in polysaccharide export with SLBB domain